MNITVIADKDGHVVGTYRQPAQAPKDGPVFQIHGGPGHTVHRLELPAEFDKLESADELHRRLGEYIKKLPPKRG
jgi:hypothetical protein